ncbi:Hypothetical protein CINCED_3A016909 [Cinara cedri]|uniref:Uncharacterized protein n=1 Tax=Cinara cedri TaxID=506608 RepID=A0A5E4N6U1_9HEMI|nr:Hypothetical protein CINCED_3A016909 [Cinara cedri]
MTIAKFVLALLVFKFYVHVVAGSGECTPPWMAINNPFLKKIETNTKWLGKTFSCPFIMGDPKKEYCCYDSSGNVECCDFQDYFFFRLLCLVPVIIIATIGLLVSTIVCFITCFVCPCCYIYKRRRNTGIIAIYAYNLKVFFLNLS